MLQRLSDSWRDTLAWDVSFRQLGSGGDAQDQPFIKQPSLRWAFHKLVIANLDGGLWYSYDKSWTLAHRYDAV